MNRETESHFSNLPKINIKRSSFKRPHDHKTTFNTGEIVPIYVDADILPGDTVKMNMASLVRMSTPIFPVMDNAYMDIYFFFVPHRLVWEHWREFWGENRQTAWEQETEYEIPQIESPAAGWAKGSLADYMGIPINIGGLSVNHLPFRAYCQIINDWFRDENLKDPCMMNTDETTLTGINYVQGTYDYTTDIQLGAACYKAAKFHDYFTSALPEPLKHGAEIYIPFTENAPVVPGPINTNLEYPYDNVYFADKQAGAAIESGSLHLGSGGNLYADSTAEIRPVIGNPIPTNLWADLTNAIGTSVNNIRQAIAIQEFYEAQARGGSRYIEFIKNIFGVTSPDGRQQRAEYMGGARVTINMDQVLQTSSTDATSPQGNTSAFSVTTSRDSMFTHSFTEHGTLMGLAVIRTDHTYQQGLERMWSRKKFTDFYVPQFANLGEQAILNKEIYATGTSTDDEAFGYQEAWADYRYKPNRISGAFRSTYAQSLDAWHYGDEYNAQPYLSSDWIDEPKDNVDRTLAVQADLENQFLADFYFDATYVRPMPVYSIPSFRDFF